MPDPDDLTLEQWAEFGRWCWGKRVHEEEGLPVEPWSEPEVPIGP